MLLTQWVCLIGCGEMSRRFGTGEDYHQAFIGDNPDGGSVAYTEFAEYLNDLGIISQIKKLGDMGFVSKYAVPENLVNRPDELLKPGSLYLAIDSQIDEKDNYYLFYVNPLDWALSDHSLPHSPYTQNTIGAFYLKIPFLTKWAKGDAIGFEKGGWQNISSEAGLVKPNRKSYFGSNYFSFYRLPEAEVVGLFNWVGF